MTVTTKIETITPETAEKYLSLSPGNRKITKKRVKIYAGQMKLGEWKITTDCIGFDERGALVAGHHRLLACVSAGVPFTTNVTRGLEEGVGAYIDTGVIQGASDFLQRQGYGYSELKAAITRQVLFDKHGTFNGTSSGGTSVYLSNKDIEKELLANAHLVDSIAFFENNFFQTLKRGSRLLPCALAGFLYYRFGVQNRVAANNFFRILCGFDSTSTFDPAFLLREKLIGNAAAKTKMQVREVIAITIKVWKAYRDNEPMTISGVRFRTGGQHPETFPTLD